MISFSSTGEYLQTFGRRGGGPGELEVPVTLSVASDGTLSVLDLGKRGLSRFAPNSSALDIRRIELLYGGEHLIHTPDGLPLEIAETYRGGGTTVYDKVVLLRPDDSVEEIASLAAPLPRTVEYTGCVTMTGKPLFAPRLNWDATGDLIAENHTVAYEIDVFRGASRTASYRRDVPLRSVDRQIARAELGEGRTIVWPNGKCRIDPDEMLDKSGFAEVLPAISGIAFSPDGEIWVRRWALRGESPVIDVLDVDGRYLGTLRPRSPFPYAFISPDTLLVERRDDLDVEYVVAYSVVRGRQSRTGMNPLHRDPLAVPQ